MSTTDTLPRLHSWQAPTGRYVERGQIVRIEGERGRWKFLAYVDHPRHPHVEVVSTGSVKSIRAFDPARVHGVSKQFAR